MIHARVQCYLEALAARELEGVIELFADEVDWYVPGNQEIAPWVGSRTSKQEVKEFFQLLWDNTKPLDVKIENLMVQDDSAVITGSITALMLKSESVFSSPFSMQIDYYKGLIIKYRLLEDSNELVRILSENSPDKKR